MARSRHPGRRSWWPLLGLVIALAGCEDDLPEATHIRHMRILGARVDVIEPAEADRATPRPGERARVSFATVFPEQENDTSDSQTMLINCTAPERFTGGLPLCQEFLDLVNSADEDVEGALSMVEAEKLGCEQARMVPGPWRNDPTVPVEVSFAGVTLQCINGQPEAEFELAEDFAADQALFLGVVCEQGEAFVDPTEPTLFGCDDNDGETLRIHGLIPVAQEPEEVNHHPSMEAAELFFDGTPWLPVDPEDPPPDENCENAVDGESVFVVDPLEHTIELRYDPGERERGPDGELETLEFSVYATRPEVERRFTLFTAESEPVEVESGEEALVASLTWDPPSLPRASDGEPTLPESVLVRFYITVLDQRGGFDVATRAVCLR